VTTSDGEAPVTIAIEGVDDAGVVAAIQNAIRAVCREIPVDARCTVALAPSDMRGRWDLGLKSPAGRQLASFSGAADRLPELVAQHLRRMLQRPLTRRT
jgi:hypothetical protein